MPLINLKNKSSCSIYFWKFSIRVNFKRASACFHIEAVTSRRRLNTFQDSQESDKSMNVQSSHSLGLVSVNSSGSILDMGTAQALISLC